MILSPATEPLLKNWSAVQMLIGCAVGRSGNVASDAFNNPGVEFLAVAASGRSMVDGSTGCRSDRGGSRGLRIIVPAVVMTLSILINCKAELRSGSGSATKVKNGKTA
jgi:hypothetical protein